MSYEDYEEEVAREKEKNEKILGIFEKWLSESGIKEKTINKHIDNVSFYINEYLLYDDCVPANEGITSMDGFFNWFFPRKAMWSSKASTKETVASLKKFYKCLAAVGLVKDDDYEFMLSEVKSNMDDWLDHYDNQYDW